jgi:hypothetical protein
MVFSEFPLVVSEQGLKQPHRTRWIPGTTCPGCDIIAGAETHRMARTQ